MSPRPETLCHCGRPLHYRDPVNEYAVTALVRQMGRYVLVTYGGRTWLVDRHYIALHGLRSEDLPQLGFEEVRRD